MRATFPCPRCGATLEAEGKVTIGDRTFPVYQCETCVVPWMLGSETVDAAYTFAVKDGQPFDPSADD